MTMELIKRDMTKCPPQRGTLTVKEQREKLKQAYWPVLKNCLNVGDRSSYEKFEKQRDDALRFLSTYEAKMKAPFKGGIDE